MDAAPMLLERHERGIHALCRAPRGLGPGAAGPGAAGPFGMMISLLKPIRQSISACPNSCEDVHLWPKSRCSKGNLMNRPKDPGIRTRWVAVLAAGRRPKLAAALAAGRRWRLVAAGCAVVLAAPLAVVAATG